MVSFSRPDQNFQDKLTLIHTASNRCLDATRRRKLDDVILAKCNGGEGQKWTLEGYL